MLGALWILLFTAIIGLILYILDRRGRTADLPAQEAPQPVSTEEEEKEAEGANGECCGLHLVCEKDSLSPMSDEILYYDDEELDRFFGREPESYTPEETEEFRDILMTLRPEDVSGWARSITQRRLQLPPDVRDELLLLVNEQRNKEAVS